MKQGHTRLYTHIVKYSKEVKWSPWTWVGTGIHGNKAVCPKRCVVCVEVGPGAMVMARHRVESGGRKVEYKGTLNITFTIQNFAALGRC